MLKQVDYKTFVFLVVMSGLVLIRCLPQIVSPFPTRDSGTFLYVGWRWLEGDIPYRDAWDHKPPGIFVINTLGLWLANGDKIGVHLLEYVFILTAFGVLYDISRKRYGQLIAMFVTILILLSTISLVFGHNFTETYTLVFIAVTFWMLAQKDIDDWGRGRLIGVGVLAALTFCMKQQQAMMTYIALGLYLLVDRGYKNQWRRLIHEVVWLGLGFGLIIGLVVAYFYWHEALDDLWDAVIIYNGNLSTILVLNSTLAQRLDSLFKVSQYLLIPTSVAAFGFITLLFNWFKGLQLTSFQKICMCAFVLELAITLIATHAFPHYYLLLVPTCIILSGEFLFYIFQNININVLRWAAVDLSLSILLYSLLLIFMDVSHKELVIPDADNLPFIKVIHAHVEEESLLFWGEYGGMNFMVKRRSPSRYIRVYHFLVTRNYQSSALIDKYVQSLETDPPSLIIDASGTAKNRIPPLDREARQQWQPVWDLSEVWNVYPLPEAEKIYQYIEDNYQVNSNIELHNPSWIVYERIPPSNQ